MENEFSGPYLIRAKSAKNSAHLWNGVDTACRMWSSGGLSQSRKWEIREDRGDHPICTMCMTNARHGHFQKSVEGSPILIGEESIAPVDLRGAEDEQITLTYGLIMAGRSQRGGFSKAQVAELGVGWPLEAGWLEKKVGTKIQTSRFERFLALRN